MTCDDVAEALDAWLSDNGYDGLVCHEAECGCDVGDLMPCGTLENLECCEPTACADPQPDLP